jgi:S1-C subfamily serine protease
MTRADWLALAFVALVAVLGLRKGVVGSALSLAGVVAGALLGGWLAPDVIPGGDESAYAPLVALGGAVVGALAFEAVGTFLASLTRPSLRLRSLRALDSGGGLVLGAALGFAVVWVAGSVALHFPNQTELRRSAQRSVVLRNLNDVVTPDRLIRAIQRVDPFPSIAGPAAPVAPPDPGLVGTPAVQRSAASVVRVLGNACGLAVSGSGWVAAPSLVVTAAHVVAGQSETSVQLGDRRLPAIAVAFDPQNDLAVLRVVGELGAPPLRIGRGSAGAPVAILGYPENGPLAVTAGRLGRTAVILSDDAYGRGPVLRTITSLRGRVRHGNSGGPAINARGEVETTIFAARVGSSGGFGVPPAVVRSLLNSVDTPVSTGQCAP